VAAFTVVSDKPLDAPRRADLDRCVHCGLCLQACPTYRQLGVEMDSPRGRIYQMVQVSEGAAITDAYRAHLDLCLACRACETACPSGVEYGRLIESARAEIETKTKRSWFARFFRGFIFDRLLPSPALLTIAGSALWLYQVTGLQRFIRATHVLGVFDLDQLEALTPRAETPFFFGQIGKTFPAHGEKRFRVAMLAGCIGSVSFARLNEATVRVLQRNGCEVVIPAGQTCCGALHVHSGLPESTRRLARRNIDAMLDGGFDAIISNAAGCGSTLKEYGHLLQHDRFYSKKAERFSGLMKDATEFLAGINLNQDMKPLRMRVTYQDSCHLAHGQKIKKAPRQLIAQIPGVDFREMPMADVCCGSAGIYNVLQTAMAMQVLDEKMANIDLVKPDVIATANPGCMLQLEAGVARAGGKQRVLHVIQLLDEAYQASV
jgi:glycolate oxidase iron-sulfur subunit